MNNFFCLIEDGIIYQVDTYNKVAIGYTNEMYNELKETTQGYYDKLVELEVIVPPKTQEEINKELQEALAESQKSLKESQETNLKMLTMMEKIEQRMNAKETKQNRYNKKEGEA